jgi:WD40 repeat protein
MLLLKSAGEIRQLAYASDASLLGAWAHSANSRSPEVSWWDLRTGDRLRPTHLSGWPTHVAIASRADRIAYMTGSGVYFIQRNDEFVGRGDSGIARRDTMAITPDASLLAVSGKAQLQPIQRSVIEVYRANQPLSPYRRFSSAVRVHTLSLSADGRFLASGGEGGLTIWDLTQGESVATASFQSNIVDQIVFSPDGLGFAVLRGEDLSLHETVTARIRWMLHSREGNDFTDVAFAPGRHMLAVVSKAGIVEFCDPADSRLITKFDWQIGPLRSVAFSPDGLTCAAGNYDGQIVVWDLEE